MTHRAKATIGILTGLFLAALDGTVVATGMPRIMDELGGIQVYSLPVAIFLLFQTVSMPIWGRLSDMYGRSRFHLLAVLVLVGASLFCGFAHSMTSFLAYRAIQGLGAGGVMALSFTMIGDLYEGEERAKVQGAITSVWGLAALIGPQLGGLIAEHWSWRGIFFLNVPVGIAAILIVQATWERRPVERKGLPDVPGAVLLAIVSGCLLAGFGLGGHGVWPSALGCFGAAIVGLIMLIVVERRSADPFLSYDLFRIRMFGTGAATGVFAMVSLFSAIVFVPLLVTGVLGEVLPWGGLMLTVMMVPWLVCSALTRILLNRFGFRILSVVGMLACAGAYVLLSRVSAGDSLLAVAGPMLLLGVGLGVTVAPLLIAAQNAVPRDRLGAATSLTQFSRSMGGAIGLAVMGGILGVATGGQDLAGIIKAPETLTAEELETFVAQLQSGLTQVFLCSAVAAAIGIVFGFAIPGRKGVEPAAA